MRVCRDERWWWPVTVIFLVACNCPSRTAFPSSHATNPLRDPVRPIGNFFGQYYVPTTSGRRETVSAIRHGSRQQVLLMRRRFFLFRTSVDNDDATIVPSFLRPPLSMLLLISLLSLSLRRLCTSSSLTAAAVDVVAVAAADVTVTDGRWTSTGKLRSRPIADAVHIIIITIIIIKITITQTSWIVKWLWQLYYCYGR